MQFNVDPLASNRIETRFTGTSPLVAVPEGMREVLYPDALVSSLYFGTADPHQPIPPGVAMRFRYRSSEPVAPEHAIHILEPGQVGTLELKLRSDADGNERISKYYAPDLHLGEVTEALADPDHPSPTIRKQHGYFFDQAMEVFEGQPTKPVILFQALRRHFLPSYAPVRITLDTDNSIWIIGEEAPADMVFAARAHNIGHSILEIKSSDSLDALKVDAQKLMVGMFGEHTDFASRGHIKRDYGKRALRESGIPEFTSPDFIQSPDNPYSRSFHEREMKFEAQSDPREALEVLPSKIDGVHLGRCEESSIRFRNRTVDDLTIIEKSRYDSFNPSAFQYKIDITSDQPGQLVRKEFTEPSLAGLLSRLGRAASSIDLLEVEEVTNMAFGTRHRLGRNAVLAETGNVFVILADHCAASDERPPLDQIEIEHIGKLGFASESQPDIAAIDRDFTLLRELVQAHLGATCGLSPTTLTKQDWLNS